MAAPAKYTVYQDTEQWIPLFNWFWLAPGESGMGHGAYPAKFIATFFAWLGTRGKQLTPAEREAAEEAKRKREQEELRQRVKGLTGR